jgi:hypothetical protein
MLAYLVPGSVFRNEGIVMEQSILRTPVDPEAKLMKRPYLAAKSQGHGRDQRRKRRRIQGSRFGKSTKVNLLAAVVVRNLTEPCRVRVLEGPQNQSSG